MSTVQQISTVFSQPGSASGQKPIIVGLYGLPGSGKTFLLNHLKKVLGQDEFAFYEGSEVIASTISGGLDAFQNLPDQEKVQWRQRAIDSIRENSIKLGKVAVVTGHLMFWGTEQEIGQTVYTQNDLEAFTHILYLGISPETIIQYRQHDTGKNRPCSSAFHLRRWQNAEVILLTQLCYDHNILFSVISQQSVLLNKTTSLLRDFKDHNEKCNLDRAERALDATLIASHKQAEVILVLDADRTLIAEDTGKIFWEKVSDSRQPIEERKLKALFSSRLGYSYTAFRQAMLLHEEAAADEQEFDVVCQQVASAVNVHSTFLDLLQLVSEQSHVSAMIFTCGLQSVWLKILEKHNLSHKVGLIGGGRISDGFVVSPLVKEALVSRLQKVYQTSVWAFGDSPLDLGMLKMADHAIVVVGEVNIRSKSMDLALANAVKNDGLEAHQMLLPSSVTPRLDDSILPLARLDQQMIDLILNKRHRYAGEQVIHMTERNSARLLMTPMRNASVAGPSLKEAHRRVGEYLAIEVLADILGVEKYPIQHVLGDFVTGFRPCNEYETLIVALMRGGEPMASGVHDVFERSMFVHARSPDDVTTSHLHRRSNIILVDSVINTGKSVVQFVRHIRQFSSTIRITIVAGVVQSQSVSQGSFAEELARDWRLRLITLRLSENKYNGSGGTDTGNRLFNTMEML